MRELGPGFTLTYTAGLQSRVLLDVTPNMRNVGRIVDEDEIIQLYQRTDILLFPTRQEGFGLVALEAMACGVPVIATRGTALPEVVEDGITGILCPEGDISAFVAACRRLATNRDLWQTTSAAARRRTEMLFSEDIIIPQYIALYEALLSGTS
jgi:glycosyltransferase involved in cell wall biosynthesis